MTPELSGTASIRWPLVARRLITLVVAVGAAAAGLGCSPDETSAAEPTPTLAAQPAETPEPIAIAEPTPSPTSVPTETPPEPAIDPGPFGDLDPLAAWIFEPDDPASVGKGGSAQRAESVHSIGHAVRFDGVSDHLLIADHGDAVGDRLKPTSAFSITFWFRVERAPADADHDYLARWRWYGWGIRVTGDSLYADVWHQPAESEPVQVTLSGPVIDDGWHHLALTFDGTTDRLFIDGALVDESPTEGPIFYLAVDPTDDCCGTGGALAFGRDGDVNANYFAGLLDDAALFDRALTPTEISTLATRR